MKTIIIGFSRPKKINLFSRAIMWADKTAYSHVYVKWKWNSIERDIIYQASKLAVNFESDVTFNSHAVVVEEYEVTLSDECHKTVMQFCMDNSNKPYGIKEILGFAWVKLCAKMGKKVRNPFPTNGNSYVCSKIGMEILQVAKIVDVNLDSDDIDPLDLNNIIQEAGLKRLTPAEGPQ